MAALTWPPPCYSRPGGMRGPFLPYSGRVQVRASRSSHCLSGSPVYCTPIPVPPLQASTATLTENGQTTVCRSKIGLRGLIWVYAAW